MLRAESTIDVKVGILGCGRVASRFPSEASVVNGIHVVAAYDIDVVAIDKLTNGNDGITAFRNLDDFLDAIDAVYLATPHNSHYQYAKKCIERGKHVLVETPMVLNSDQARELFKLAEDHGVILMEANKTAHCPAFNHLIVMVKSGVIGEVVDIEASISQLLDKKGREFDSAQAGGAMHEEGSYPLLPIIKLMGVNYEKLMLFSRIDNEGISPLQRKVLTH